METRTVHVPLDVYEKLQRIAAHNDRSVPQQLRVIVRKIRDVKEKA